MLARPAKVYDFTAFARRQPTTPPPGDRIDAQLQNHADAITAVQLAVEKLIAAQAKVDDVEIKTLAAEIKAFARSRVRRPHPIGRLRQGPRRPGAAPAQARVGRSRSRPRRRRSRRGASGGGGARCAIAAQAPTSATSQRFAPGQAMPLLGYGAGGFYASDDAGAAAVSADYAQVCDRMGRAPARHHPAQHSRHQFDLRRALVAVAGGRSRAANAFGMLAWWYMGAWPGPPPTHARSRRPAQPIPPGGMYFDTDLGIMLVWNGSTWVPPGPGRCSRHDREPVLSRDRRPDGVSAQRRRSLRPYLRFQPDQARRLARARQRRAP